jgi:hypothetical protein
LTNVETMTKPEIRMATKRRGYSMELESSRSL